MKKMAIKKRTGIKKYQFIVIVIVFAIVLAYPLISYLGRLIKANMINYASSEVRKITLVVLTNAINLTINENPRFNDMFTIKTNQNGEIELLDFDTIEVNKFLNRTANLVQINFQALEQGKISELGKSNAFGEYNTNTIKNGVIYQMPVSYMFNSPLLSNIGPKIPIRVNLARSVYSYLETELEEYGINNVMVKIIVTIKVVEKINMPLVYSQIEVVSPTVVAVKMIQGKIPEYYQQSGEGKISIPFSNSP